MTLFLSLALKYLRLKIAALIVRTFVRLVGRIQRALKGPADWEAAYPNVTKEYHIDSTKTAGRRIKIRVWDPPDVAKDVKRPVHITFHGSGYLIPSLGNDSDYCEYLAKELGCTVLDCDYAKAPEYPFPNAYNDVLDVVHHVVARSSDSDSPWDEKRITLGGFSAGAGLSLCVTANESFVQEHVKALVCIYPPGDLSDPPGPPPMGPPGSTAPVLSPPIIKLFNTAYSFPSSNLADPKISPFRADWSAYGKRKGGGKALVLSGEYDNLLKGGKRTVAKMRDQGVDVEFHLIQDVGHAWDKTCRPGTWEHERKTQAYEYVVEFLKVVYRDA